MTVGFKQLVCLIAGVFLLALGGGLMGGRLAALARVPGPTEQPHETTAMSAPEAAPVEPVPAEPAPIDVAVPDAPAEPVVPAPSPVEPQPPVKPVPAPAPSQAAFVVQAMATMSRNDARNARKHMMAVGFPAGIFEADLGDRGVWYRVYVGPYESEEEARQTLAAVQAIPGYGQSFVKPLE